ncbi:MAG: GH116 family glycosyl-hydrolase [Thermoproteota archaeon]
MVLDSKCPGLRDGRTRSFEGNMLSEIAFPIGGIGTGTVSLGGRGNLRDWEIFNRPGKGKDLPYTFFSIWFREEGSKPVSRVLESRIPPPYRGSHGIPWSYVPGLPRLAKTRFRGEYPFARIDFEDNIPLEISLEAFNPLIPLNEKDSGLPVAIFKWKVRNRSARRIRLTLAMSLFNPVGYDGTSTLVNRFNDLFGQNLNELVRDTGLTGIRMSSSKYPREDPKFGSMILATSWKEITYTLRWERSVWWDDVQSFWRDFSEDGLLAEEPSADPSMEGETDVGTLGLLATLDPKEEVVLPFILTWYFPNLVNYWNREEEVRGKRIGNFYAKLFKDALDVAKYVVKEFERLERETRLFHRTLFESTLPDYVLDAVSSQVSTIRTPTCLWAEDGRFYAFEGCSDNSGCCWMNCTHVWNYEQTLAHLFPSLERTMRLTDFLNNTDENGNMVFRTLVPLTGARWRFKPAADGQMGCIMKLYREWKLSGDEEFLRMLWPNAKKALEYAWKTWDKDCDGLMEGEQHNTYDIEFYGPNPMVTSLYLGALRAAEEMAKRLGDSESAEKYREVFEKGRANFSKLLWNGEYFVQRFQGNPNIRYQFGEGCLSDQLLGQWFSHVVGLGYLLPEEQVKSALMAVFRYNWKESLLEHENCQRTYALNDESGLVLCSWPKGGKPNYPFPYCDEVWTGIEYQVAAHLIYEGFVNEGLKIVKGARDRHDGVKRNPWDEAECGHHYARAMSSWSLLLALSGFEYSAPEKTIGFAPRVSKNNFRCFFSTGGCWGSYSRQLKQGLQKEVIEIRYGRLELQKVRLVVDRPPAVGFKVKHSSKGELDALLNIEEKYATILFKEPVSLGSGDSLEIVIT